MKTFCSIAPLPGNDEEVNPIDLVFQLGRTKRFGGWGDPEWSVLHHSMLVTLMYLRYYGARNPHHALLHDGHEYITGDIPTPVKNAIGRPGVDQLQHELDERIYKFLDISMPNSAEEHKVEMCDRAALFVEGYYFAPKGTFEHLRTNNGDWQSMPPERKDIVLNIIESMGLEEVSSKMKEWK